jgi:predicted HD phosphohydrolase
MNKKFRHLSEIDEKACAWYMDRFAEQDELLVDRLFEFISRLDELPEYSGISQLEHGLITATLAVEAKQPDDVVIGALFHDVGKIACQFNHGAISAEMVKFLVRPDMYHGPDMYHAINTHELFQGQYHYGLTKLGDPQEYKKFKNESWFELGLKLNEWDAAAFDINKKFIKLHEFKPVAKALLKKKAKSKKSA